MGSNCKFEKFSERMKKFVGDPFYDLIPIYLDVFGGDTELFKKLLESYGIPLIRSKNGTVDSTRKKVLSPSYRTM